MIHHTPLQMLVGCSRAFPPSCPPNPRPQEGCTSCKSLVTAGKASSSNSSHIAIRSVDYQLSGDGRCRATAASFRCCSVGNSAHWRTEQKQNGETCGIGAGQLRSTFLPRFRNGVDRTLVPRKSFGKVSHCRAQGCRSRASLPVDLWEEKLFHGRRGGAERENLVSKVASKRGSRARRVVAAQASAAGAASAPPAPRNFFATLWANFLTICVSWAARLQSIRIGWLDLLTMLRIVLLAAGAFGAYVASKRAWAKIREKADGKSEGGGGGPAGGVGGDGEGSPMQVLARGATCLQSNMGPWSITDMAFGLTAMAKVTEKKPPPLPGKEVKDLPKDSNFLLRAQHWRALSEAVYAQDPASFSLFSNLPESSLVASAWEPSHETFRPAYAVFVDAPYGAVVLAVRGTSHIIDMLLNSGASPESFGEDGGYAHGGFVHAAKILHEEVLPHIEKAFKDHSGGSKELKLVVVGHSLGAAVGTLVSLKLREKWPDLRCWAFSPPACMSLDLAQECRAFTTSFVVAHDLVPRISLKSVEKLRTRIQEFDWDEVEVVAKDDEDWQNLKKGMETFKSVQTAQRDAMEKITNLSGNRGTSDEKGEEECTPKPPPLHPPGRLLVMGSDPPGCGKMPEQRSNVAPQRNYGAYITFDEAKKITWRMFEAQQEDMEEIVVSPWIVSDHMLGTMCEAISYFQSSCPPAVK